LVGFMQVDEERRNLYVRDARRRGITILPPDVNKSKQNFTIGHDTIRYGLQAVRGVGEVAADAIVTGAPYRCLQDYLDRAGRGANKAALVPLIKIGAFDSIDSDRAGLLKELEQYWIEKDLAESTLANALRLEKVVARRRAKPERQIEIPDFTDPHVVYAIEQDLVGSFITVDPMEPYLKIIDTEMTVRSPAMIRRYQPGQQLVIGGQIVKLNKHVVKSGFTAGQTMAFLGVQWQGDDYDITVFPKVFARYDLLLKEGTPVLCGCERLAPRKDGQDGGVSLRELFRLDLYS